MRPLDIPELTRLGNRGVVVNVRRAGVTKDLVPYIVLIDGTTFSLPTELLEWVDSAILFDLSGPAEFGRRRERDGYLNGYYGEWLTDETNYFAPTLEKFRPEDFAENHKLTTAAQSYPMEPSRNLPASSLHYKFSKLRRDYQRAHDLMVAMSPDHRSFVADPGALDELRHALDDLAADAGAAWEEFRKIVLARHSLSGLKSDEADRRLVQADPVWGLRMERAWSQLFGRLKDARNALQHETFWSNAFGAVFPPSSPVLVDAQVSTKKGDVYFLRDARRAIRCLKALGDLWGIEPTLPEFDEACTACLSDDWRIEAD